MKQILMEIFLKPSSIILFFLLVSLFFLVIRKKKAAYALMIFSISAIFIIFGSSIGSLSLAVLEARFLPARETSERVSGVIIVEFVDLIYDQTTGEIDLGKRDQQTYVQTSLKNRYPSLPIVRAVVGTATEIGGDQAAEVGIGPNAGSDMPIVQVLDMRHLVAKFEDMSETSEGRGWVLAAPAFRLPRLIGVFCAQGWTLVPFGTEYMAVDILDRWSPSASFAELEFFDLATFEWAALVAYRMNGYTTEIFPSPETKCVRRYGLSKS